MNPAYTAVILLSLLSSVTTCLGVALAILLQENTRAIATGLGFSVGIMILIPVLDLIPESIAITGVVAALTTALFSATVIWAAHLAFSHFHLAEPLIKSAYLVVFGLILHDVPEGFAMANAYMASPALGVLVAVAIALHNLPEEFAMAVPAVVFRSKRFLFGAAMLSALAEPVGAIIGLVAVGVAPSLHAHFLAFAAGAMVFVSTHELIPMARRYRQIRSFAAGLVLSLIVYGLLARLTIGHLRIAA
ncbi:MAG TPA: ZIP family metal transporter [Candidatus Binatia bacterium]|nr:ZIP family metal transporter [Candidatus Binatia bacterium]